MSKGRTRATARWRRLDGPGEDSCRLIEEPDGWMLFGHARFEQSGVHAALDYVVRCNSGFEALSADVTGRLDGSEVAWKMQRETRGWQLGEAPPVLAGCTDIDLAFTPATNLLPLRRLLPERPVRVAAAWFREGQGGSLSRLEQSYAPRGPGLVGYASESFEAELSVHPSGFVTHYPGLWEGTVDEE